MFSSGLDLPLYLPCFKEHLSADKIELRNWWELGLVAPGRGDLSSPATRILSLTSDNISCRPLSLVNIMSPHHHTELSLDHSILNISYNDFETVWNNVNRPEGDVLNDMIFLNTMNHCLHCLHCLQWRSMSVRLVYLPSVHTWLHTRLLYSSALSTL